MKKEAGFAGFVAAAICLAVLAPVPAQETTEKVPAAWRPVGSSRHGGLLGERVVLWEQHRLRHMVDGEDGYLLSGFESRPGRHAWQGEHVGKWLHAATLAQERTGDEKLAKTLKDVVDRLLAAQEPNGYLGTYAEKNRFYNAPAATSWDVWSHRYNLYGLLTYDRFHPDDRIVKACKRMADLLIGTFGPGKEDITRNGTRHGISSMTVLESIMMLYERTHEKTYLDFAQHLVAMSEANPGLRLMGAMLEKKDVSGPGEGKAYQLMANLLGYLRLYRCTGDERYLETVRNGWENIRAHHLYVTGGPWSRPMPYNGNRECFALAKDFDPTAGVVERCSTVTWIQLNLHLLELTGRARYAREAERALFNDLIAGQYPEGIDWCYCIKANGVCRGFRTKITCCASSGPRALEMFAYYLVGEVDGGVALAGLVPCRAVLPESCGKAEIQVTGNYPFLSKVGIRFDKADGKRFALEFREPAGTRLTSIRINGEKAALSKNERGFYRISRTWKTGDAVALECEYRLESHVVTPTEGTNWGAFTYGPWALAQKVDKGAALDEPLVGKDVRSQPASQWLEPIASEGAGGPRFRVKGTQVVLEPYYGATGRTAGPRTYFRF